MIDGGSVSFLVSQLSSQGPVFLVYLAAIVLALMYMGRAKVPSILTLFGVVISVLTTIMSVAAHSYVISNRVDGASLGNQMMLISVMGSIGRAVGIGFLVAAVFVGRNYVPPADRYLHE